MEVSYTTATWLDKAKKNLAISNLSIDGVAYGYVRANVETSVIGKMFLDYITENKIELETDPMPEEFIETFSDDEMLKTAIILAVQSEIDYAAKTRGYDNANSCVSYYNSTDPVFAKEAKAMVKWRDQCWRKCYNLLDDYLARKIERPTVDSILQSLPKMDWDDE